MKITTTLRIEEKLYEAVKKLAEKENRSVNWALCEMIERGVKK